MVKDALKDDLKARIASRRAVVFVGTGVSWSAAQTPLAGWKGFLEAGIQVCDSRLGASLSVGWAQRQRDAFEKGDLDEWLNVAEAVSRKLSAPRGGEFRRWLRETVGAPEVANPGVMEALAMLGVPLVTTNYDDLLRHVTGRRPITWRQDNHVTKFVQERQLEDVLHIHGHWEDSESVILGVRSYEQVRNYDFMQTTLRTLLIANTAVFVGYGAGLGDPNFKPLRDWMADVLGGSEHRHYRLCLRSEAEEIARTHDGEPIVPLVYGDVHDEIEGYLRSLIPAGVDKPGPQQPRP